MSTADLIQQYLDDDISEDDADFDPQQPDVEDDRRTAMLSDTMSNDDSDREADARPGVSKFVDHMADSDDDSEGDVDDLGGDFLAEEEEGGNSDDLNEPFADPNERRPEETEEEHEARMLAARWKVYRVKKAQIERDMVAYINDIAKHQAIRQEKDIHGKGKRVAKLIISKAVIQTAQDLLTAMRTTDQDDIDPEGRPGFTAESCLLDPAFSCYKKALFPLWDSASADANCEALEIALQIMARLLRLHPYTATADGQGFLADDKTKSKGPTYQILKEYHARAQTFKSELVTKESFYRGLKFLRTVHQFREDHEGYTEEQLALKNTLREALDAVRADPMPSSEEIVEIGLSALLSPMGRLLFVPSREDGEVLTSDEDADNAVSLNASGGYEYILAKDMARMRLARYTRAEIVNFMTTRVNHLKTVVSSSFTRVDGVVCLRTSEIFKEVIRGLLRLPIHTEKESSNLYGIRYMQVYLLNGLVKHRLMAPLESDIKELIKRECITRNGGSSTRRPANAPVPSDDRRIWRIMDVVFYCLCQVNADKAAEIIFEPRCDSAKDAVPAAEKAAQTRNGHCPISNIGMRLRQATYQQRNQARHSQFNPAGLKEKIISKHSQLKVLSFTADKLTGQSRRGYLPTTLWKEKLLFHRPKHFILDTDHTGFPVESHERQNDLFNEGSTKEHVVEFLNDFIEPNLQHFSVGWMDDVNAQIRGATSEVTWDMTLRFMSLVGWMLRFYRHKMTFLIKHAKIVRKYRADLEEYRNKYGDSGRRALNNTNVKRPDYSCDLQVKINYGGRPTMVSLDDEIFHLVTEHNGEKLDALVKYAIYPIARQLKPLIAMGTLTFYLDFIISSILRMRKSAMPGPMAAMSMKVVTEVFDLSLFMMTLENGNLIRELGIHTLENLLKLGIGVIIPELMAGYSITSHDPSLFTCCLRIVSQMDKIPQCLAEYGAPDHVLKSADRSKLRVALRKMEQSGINPLRAQQSDFSRFGMLKDFKYEELLCALTHEKIMLVMLKTFENHAQHSQTFNDTLAHVLNRLVERRGPSHPEDGGLFLSLPWLIQCHNTCSNRDLRMDDPIYMFCLNVVQYFWKVFERNKLVAIELLYCKRTTRLDKPMNLGHEGHLNSLYTAYTSGADHEALKNGGNAFDGGSGGNTDGPVKLRRQENLAPFTAEETKNLINAWQQHRNSSSVSTMLEKVLKGQRWRRPKRQLRLQLQRLGVLEPMGRDSDEYMWSRIASNIVEMIYGMVFEVYRSESATKLSIVQWTNEISGDAGLESSDLSSATRTVRAICERLNKVTKDILSRREVTALECDPVDLRVPAHVRMEWAELDKCCHWIFQWVENEQDEVTMTKLFPCLDLPYKSQLAKFGEFPNQAYLPASRKMERLYDLNALFESIVEEIDNNGPVAEALPELHRFKQQMSSMRKLVEKNRMIAEAVHTMTFMREDLIRGLCLMKQCSSLTLDEFFDLCKAIYDAMKDAVRLRLSYLKRNFVGFAKEASQLMSCIDGKGILGAGGGSQGVTGLFTVPENLRNCDSATWTGLTTVLNSLGYQPTNSHYYKTYLSGTPESRYFEPNTDEQWHSNHWNTPTQRHTLFHLSTFSSVQTMEQGRSLLQRLQGYPIETLAKMVDDPEGYAADRMNAAWKGNSANGEEEEGEEKRGAQMDEEDNRPAARTHAQYGCLHVAAVLKHTLLCRRLAQSGDASPELPDWLKRNVLRELLDFVKSDNTENCVSFSTKEIEDGVDDSMQGDTNRHHFHYVEVARLMSSIGGIYDPKRGQWLFMKDEHGNKPTLLISIFEEALKHDMKQLKRAMHRFIKLDDEDARDVTAFRMELCAFLDQDEETNEEQASADVPETDEIYFAQDDIPATAPMEEEIDTNFGADTVQSSCGSSTTQMPSTASMQEEYGTTQMPSTASMQEEYGTTQMPSTASMQENEELTSSQSLYTTEPNACSPPVDTQVDIDEDGKTTPGRGKTEDVSHQENRPDSCAEMQEPPHKKVQPVVMEQTHKPMIDLAALFAQAKIHGWQGAEVKTNQKLASISKVKSMLNVGQ